MNLFSPSRHRVIRLGVALLLLGAASLPYLTSLGGPFLYDDYGQIVENNFLANPANARAVLSLKTLADGSVINGRRPLTLLSFFLDRALWGADPAGWHLTNLILHVLATLALYRFFRTVSRRSGLPHRQRRIIPLVAAVLFALHPANTETVHLPAFRADILATLCTVLYLLAGTAVARRTRPLTAGLLTTSALGGVVASKESGLAAPLILLAAWWLLPRLRPGRTHMIMIAALSLLLSVAFSVACLLPQHSGIRPSFQAVGTAWNGYSLRFPSNLLTAPWLFVRMLSLLLWPFPLAVDHPVMPVTSPMDPRFTAGLTALGLCVLALPLLRRRLPTVAFAAAWFLIAWLPVANILPLLNPFAERYAYPAAPAFLLALITTAYLPSVFNPRMLRFCTAGVVLLILLEAAAALTRMSDFRDSLTLWRRTLRVEPRSARAMVWLALEHKHHGDAAAAERLFREALRTNPREVTALVNLAILAGNRGDLPEAERLLREALKLRPDRADIHWNLAVALNLRGRVSAAQEEILAALRFDPRFLPALRARALFLAAQGQYSQARAIVRRIQHISPGDTFAEQFAAAVAATGTNAVSVPVSE